MVIRGHYVGLSLTQLESIRTQLLSALESMRQGKTFSEVDMGGKMGKKQLLSYSEVVHDLKEVEYALKKELPEVYGKPVKRLIPNFNTPSKPPANGFFVTGASKLTGGIVSDGLYEFQKGRSHITYQYNYYMHSDTLSQLAKDADGVWGLYGGAGVRYDVMNGLTEVPVGRSDAYWENIEVGR